MRGLYSLRPSAEHDVIPYLLIFAARKERARGTRETWVVGNPRQWYTLGKLSWEVSPGRWILAALSSIGLFLGIVLVINAFTNFFGFGQAPYQLWAGLGLTLLGLLVVLITVRPRGEIQRTPKPLKDHDSIRIVQPELAASYPWTELVVATDRFLAALREEGHNYDQLSAKVYHKLKRALWDGASVPDYRVREYITITLEPVSRELTELVDAYVESSKYAAEAAAAAPAVETAPLAEPAPEPVAAG